MRFDLRFDDDDTLYERIAALARQEKRSVNRQILVLLGKALPSAPGSPRASRIPENFASTISPSEVAWARSECPGVNGKAETEHFVDYWLAASGSNARKVDWHRAWKVWMRKAAASSRPTSRFGRRQDETDALFDDALARARQRDLEDSSDPRGSGRTLPPGQSVLSATGDGQVHAGHVVRRGGPV